VGAIASQASRITMVKGESDEIRAPQSPRSAPSKHRPHQQAEVESAGVDEDAFADVVVPRRCACAASHRSRTCARRSTLYALLASSAVVGPGFHESAADSSTPRAARRRPSSCVVHAPVPRCTAGGPRLRSPAARHRCGNPLSATTSTGASRSACSGARSINASSCASASANVSEMVAVSPWSAP